jgi:hypothetical protein
MNPIERVRETRGTALAECQRLLDGARAEDRDLNDAERRQFEENRELADQASERLDEIAERHEATERSNRAFDIAGIRHGDPVERDYRGGDVTRDAIRTVENMRMASDDAKHALVGLIEEDDTPESPMARWALVTSNEAYRTAFGKMPQPREGSYGVHARGEQRVQRRAAAPADNELRNEHRVGISSRRSSTRRSTSRTPGRTRRSRRSRRRRRSRRTTTTASRATA